MRPPTQRLNHRVFKKERAIISAMRGLAVLRDHDSRKYALRTSALFQSLRLSIVSATPVNFHHSSTRPIKMQQAMTTTVIHPATTQ